MTLRTSFQPPWMSVWVPWYATPKFSDQRFWAQVPHRQSSPSTSGRTRPGEPVDEPPRVYRDRGIVGHRSLNRASAHFARKSEEFAAEVSGFPVKRGKENMGNAPSISDRRQMNCRGLA